jgi:hypothetical protein
MRVYHFTSVKYAVEDIQNQRLKIARINELNDPFELLAADLLDKRDRQAFAKFKNQMNEKFGIVCFSGSWESPLLWGHYADRHMGIALGFDVADEKLMEVNYTAMRPKVEFDQQTRKVINGPQVLDRLIRTKFTEWQYENEHRMYGQIGKAEQKSKLSFIKFSEDLVLREVILGMNCVKPIQEVRKLVNAKVSKVKILKAGMALRKFKVIEDRSFREGI